MSPEAQKHIDEKTLRVLKVFNKIDETVSKATFPLLRWLMKQTGVETYRVSTFGEQQVVVRKLKSEIANSISIKIAEGDFSEGLFSEREWPPDSRIRIAKVPEGSAPKEIRRSWVGTEMDAYKLLDSSGELDLVSEQPLSTPRQTKNLYAVKLGEALQSLERNSPQAAEWFKSNIAPNVDALTFKADEVKVIH